jgi:hypothetical protein
MMMPAVVLKNGMLVTRKKMRYICVRQFVVALATNILKIATVMIATVMIASQANLIAG